MTLDLFAEEEGARPWSEALAPGATVLRAFALAEAAALFAEVGRLTEVAPFRQMTTPGGLRMSVAMSGCGPCGWVSDRQGYRYAMLDPLRGLPWPPMPEAFSRLAEAAARAAGFAAFMPDACLINRYLPGTRLSLHQDRDERDLTQPIVSVSLGLAASFLFGGLRRTEPTQRVMLRHGDVVVWGGPSRLRYHAILPLKAGRHPLLGAQRINLTFRRAR